MKNIITILMASVLLANFIQADESIAEITGAFGMKLGEDFDPTGKGSAATLTDGTPLYGFVPKSPFRSLTNYYVLITPKTHLIYCIWADGKFDEGAKAEIEGEVILKLLEGKYGKREKQTAMDTLNGYNRIQQGDRHILVNVDKIGSSAIELRYYDQSLTMQAKEEMLQIEASKADASGL